MNKIIFTSIFIIMTSISIFASGINSNSATCNNNTLETYSGTSNLSANWNANTIQLHWYNGDTELNVASASQSCTYDGDLTPPSTIPTRTGYTFKGWRVRQAACINGICGLTSCMMTSAPTQIWSKGLTNGEEECFNDGPNVPCSSDAVFSNLTPYEWEASFSYGTYKGLSSCNNESVDMSSLYELIASLQERLENGEITEEEFMVAYEASIMDMYRNGTMSQPANSFTTGYTGSNCWCKATSYTPTGGTQCSLSSTPWVFHGNGADCAVFCAFRCSSNVKQSDIFRSTLFLPMN